MTLTWMNVMSREVRMWTVVGVTVRVRLGVGLGIGLGLGLGVAVALAVGFGVAFGVGDDPGRAVTPGVGDTLGPALGVPFVTGEGEKPSATPATTRSGASLWHALSQQILTTWSPSSVSVGTAMSRETRPPASA